MDYWLKGTLGTLDLIWMIKNWVKIKWFAKQSDSRTEVFELNQLLSPTLNNFEEILDLTQPELKNSTHLPLFTVNEKSNGCISMW